jgi:GNAT superfamily N-acetyltransferase
MVKESVTYWLRGYFMVPGPFLPLSSSLKLRRSSLDFVDQLAAVQRACFPSLAEDELITGAHYAAHIRRFPEGQMAVVTDDGQVVACSTDFRTNAIDVAHFKHRYIDIVDNNWLGNHDPQGAWLYGADIGVLPPYRGRGLATRLYQARQALVQQLNLKGHLAGGLLKGYGALKDRLSAEEYVAQVIAKRRFDPTLSVQLNRGFVVHGILHNYVRDPECDGKAAFLVWRNPYYDPRQPVRPS